MVKYVLNMANGLHLGPNIKEGVHHVLNDYPRLQLIIEAIDQAGGQALLVGGAVRDLFLGIPIKDVDIEVHHLSLDALDRVLVKFGPVSEMGKVYGVLRIHGLDIDWSVPRTEGPGRKPQVVLGDISLKEAFERRDLTINAMGIDLHNFEFIDPFNGLDDLKTGTLRATNPQKFIEDPLRFYRVLQFMSRFEMTPDAELTQLCKEVDLSAVSKERVEEEFKKLLLKSERPSIGFRWLQAIGRLDEVLPELGACVGVDQGTRWHPEGDVFEHSMQTLDAMAVIIHTNDMQRILGPHERSEALDDQKKLILMYGALCHDLGKALVENVCIDDHVTSHGHAEAGVNATKTMLKRFLNNHEIINGATKLVAYHMQPFQMVAPQTGLAAIKRLANRLAPEDTLYDLALLVTADQQGRGHGGKPLTKPSEEAQALVRRAEEAHVLSQIEEPVLQGRDLIDHVAPGPAMGKLLKQAYEIQINESIRDKEELKKRVLNKG